VTDPEAAKIIDELICLLSFPGTEIADFSIVSDGLAYLMRTRREHPEHPVTVSIFREMAKRGMIS
jgi:hypothetical protein